jgi:cyclase
VGKFRIIPTLLTNGVSVVKGEKFENWRTVGTVPSLGRLYAAREVDELCLLDVSASKEARRIGLHFIHELAETLRVPFSVGGGVQSVQDVTDLLQGGADKVIIGREALKETEFVREAARIVGSQAISVSVNVVRGLSGEPVLYDDPERDLREHLLRLEGAGVGEFIIQNPERDGTMIGADIDLSHWISRFIGAPFVICGGVKGWEDVLEIAKSGAGGVGVGALFQFTEATPKQLRGRLQDLGVAVRL